MSTSDRIVSANAFPSRVIRPVERCILKVIHLFRTGNSGYGLERNILCTLPGLVKLGVETVALAVTEKRASPMSQEFADRLESAGIRFLRVESEGRLPFSLARSFSEVFRAERPQIIHSHGYKCDVAMLLADVNSAVRMTTIHGWCSRNVVERFYEWIDVQCCKRMDCTIVFCEDYRQRLLVRGVPDRLVRIVPVGLDSTVVPGEGEDFRKRWGVPDDAVVVAQIGRLSQEKHPEIFVEAASQLAYRFPHARFMLVGDGPMLDHLKRQAAVAGHSDSIIFTGYLHGMADVLRSLDVAVSCSSTEGLPRTLLEAGVNSVPVVATSVGGTGDVIENGVTGILCRSGDVTAIEAGIARLVADATMRRRMGAAAKERVATHFSVEACSRHLVETYESLCTAAGGKGTE